MEKFPETKFLANILEQKFVLACWKLEKVSILVDNDQEKEV